MGARRTAPGMGTAWRAVCEPAVAGTAPPGRSPTIAARNFEIGVVRPQLDAAWRRVSYSSLSAAGASDRAASMRRGRPWTRHGRVQRRDGRRGGLEPVDRAAGEAIRHPVPAPTPICSVPSPMADLPAGASFGTLVHAVLETTDPQAADLPAELRCAARSSWPAAAGMHRRQLADGLLPVLRTPLGPIADGLALAGTSRSGTGWRRWTSRFRSAGGDGGDGGRRLDHPG